MPDKPIVTPGYMAVFQSVRFNPELMRLEYACELNIDGWWVIIPAPLNDNHSCQQTS